MRATIAVVVPVEACDGSFSFENTKRQASSASAMGSIRLRRGLTLNPNGADGEEAARTSPACARPRARFEAVKANGVTVERGTRSRGVIRRDVRGSQYL